MNVVGEERVEQTSQSLSIGPGAFKGLNAESTKNVWAVARLGAREYRDHVLICVRRALCEDLKSF